MFMMYVFASHCDDCAALTGIPDAPLDVQVEVGPQEGSLLVTWLPVTITDAGKSNGAVVSGYSVYIDGAHVKQVYSPIGWS